MSATIATPPAPVFPPPTSETNWLPPSELYKWLTDPNLVPGRDFLLVDLRRLDHEGGTIRGSVNIPLHMPGYSFQWGLGSILQLTKAAGGKAVFYCGSSKGRGARAAGWLQDYANKQAKEEGKQEPDIKSYALEGGIRGWAHAEQEYVKLIEGYDEQYWKNGGKCA
ncbi:Rhodanese-like domain-containing protein [Terfezia claveryi]|nr:Rhodanese-like domain-containing protein [Terfezia claveryi]